jgi:hypothetical protein
LRILIKPRRRSGSEVMAFGVPTAKASRFVPNMPKGTDSI